MRTAVLRCNLHRRRDTACGAPLQGWGCSTRGDRVGLRAPWSPRPTRREHRRLALGTATAPWCRGSAVSRGPTSLSDGAPGDGRGEGCTLQWLLRVHDVRCHRCMRTIVRLRHPDASEAHGRGLLLLGSIAESSHSGPPPPAGQVVSVVMADAGPLNRHAATPEGPYQLGKGPLNCVAVGVAGFEPTTSSSRTRSGALVTSQPSHQGCSFGSGTVHESPQQYGRGYGVWPPVWPPALELLEAPGAGSTRLTGLPRRLRRSNTAAFTCCAAACGSSCSQMRSTTHPAS